MRECTIAFQQFGGRQGEGRKRRERIGKPEPSRKDTPPKKGFWTPSTGTLSALSGVIAQLFPVQRTQSAGAMGGPRSMSLEGAFSGAFASPPMRSAPPTA